MVASLEDFSPDFSGPGPVQVYQDALASGHFLIQQCQGCGKHVFYPRVLCKHCGSYALTWVQASGRGIVYATSVVRRKPEKGGDYNVALIELEEGPRMLSCVADLAPEQVQIGMAVSARIGLIEGQPAVLFHGKQPESLA
ncbi:MAG: Zn-ribbon domain-containing OB-fold protein [Pseudomonadales bacterium]|jgi:uncharacterized OB-fold protein|nr:Zn-ribbon domain-containing OB-fold protein [Pseudomonadales bacterium]